MPAINLPRQTPHFYAGVGFFAEKLRSVLNAVQDRDVTFLIDGLDEIPGIESDEFPLSTGYIASTVRIIVGIGTRGAREKAALCGFKIIDLSRICAHDVRPFVEEFLARYSK